MMSVEDPIRVVVESGPASVWSQWGPLVGVVVGAILGALGQVLAGRLQRNHERRRDEIAVRRDLYIRVLANIERLRGSIADAVMAAKVEPVAVAKHEAAAIGEFNEMSVLWSEVAISGAMSVWKFMEDMRAEFKPPSAKRGTPERLAQWNAAHATVTKYKGLIMEVMRQDLGATFGPVLTMQTPPTVGASKAP
ncbi:hypothetical protein [Cellulosimicrobium cellulans]|uniref:hypothetical protein n=1 Tax=Cellulosimicrobium cellulans TaxID=1710 RepID=UPI001BA62CF8|nr:hypothetical protein [Cellulosimicrobium cellulans]QUC01092.1 hypothetical protein J5A69_07960 [Cellulosimicrobium cellulans]